MLARDEEAAVIDSLISCFQEINTRVSCRQFIFIESQSPSQLPYHSQPLQHLLRFYKYLMWRCVAGVKMPNKITLCLAATVLVFSFFPATNAFNYIEQFAVRDIMNANRRRISKDKGAFFMFHVVWNSSLEQSSQALVETCSNNIPNPHAFPLVRDKDESVDSIFNSLFKRNGSSTDFTEMRAYLQVAKDDLKSIGCAKKNCTDFESGGIVEEDKQFIVCTTESKSELSSEPDEEPFSTGPLCIGCREQGRRCMDFLCV